MWLATERSSTRSAASRMRAIGAAIRTPGSQFEIYNTCKLGDSLPVTVGFSDAVGQILIANPGLKATSPSFNFYV